MSIPYNPASDTTYPAYSVGAADGILITYEKFVCGCCKQMPTKDMDVTHMLMGITGEAGELMDAIKKVVIYGKVADIDNITEELGDLEWYMAGLRQMLNLKRDDILQKNVTKLMARYPGGTYTDSAAIARADKVVDSSGVPMESAQLQVIDMAATTETKPI